jgi:hypothetical protein
MKTCKGCGYAKWAMTADGRLHPSGVGQCTYVWKLPALPASMFWLTGREPAPLKVSIDRHAELAKHCPYWKPAP